MIYGLKRSLRSLKSLENRRVERKRIKGRNKKRYPLVPRVLNSALEYLPI